jgi:hypothetical protein
MARHLRADLDQLVGRAQDEGLGQPVAPSRSEGCVLNDEQKGQFGLVAMVRAARIPESVAESAFCLPWTSAECYHLPWVSIAT